MAAKVGCGALMGYTYRGNRPVMCGPKGLCDGCYRPAPLPAWYPRDYPVQPATEPGEIP